MKKKEIKILEVAKYIVENNSTIEKTAEHFNMSTSSIKKYINNKENLKSIDIEIYREVKRIQQNLIKIGNSVGGKNGLGTHKSKYTEFEAIGIAEKMLYESLTIKEAARVFELPPSTLYEILGKIKDEDILVDLDYLFDNNCEKYGFIRKSK